MSDKKLYQSRFGEDVTVAEDDGELSPEQERHFHDFLTAKMNDGQKRLWRFVDSINSGKTPNKEDLKFFADAFEKILRKVDPKKALEISGKQSTGRYRKTAAQVEETEITITREVWRLHKEIPCTVDSAIDQVEEAFHIPRSSIETYYKEHRSSVASAWTEIQDLLKNHLCKLAELKETGK